MDSLESSITTGGLERAGRVADVFGQAFQDDPTARYILGKLDEERKNRYLSNFLLFAARAAALNGGTLEEASDYLSCAAYVPPGRRIDNPRTLVRAGMLGIAASIGPTGLWVRCPRHPSLPAP